MYVQARYIQPCRDRSRNRAGASKRVVVLSRVPRMGPRLPRRHPAYEIVGIDLLRTMYGQISSGGQGAIPPCHPSALCGVACPGVSVHPVFRLPISLAPSSLAAWHWPAPFFAGRSGPHWKIIRRSSRIGAILRAEKAARLPGSLVQTSAPSCIPPLPACLHAMSALVPARLRRGLLGDDLCLLMRAAGLMVAPYGEGNPDLVWKSF